MVKRGYGRAAARLPSEAPLAPVALVISNAGRVEAKASTGDMCSKSVVTSITPARGRGKRASCTRRGLRPITGFVSSPKVTGGLWSLGATLGLGSFAIKGEDP